MTGLLAVTLVKPVAAGDAEYEIPVTFSVVSAGFSGGGVVLYRDGLRIASLGGGAGGGRGWVVIQLDPTTLNIIEIKAFDTWNDTFNATGGGAHFALVEYLHQIPSGSMVFLAVGDEGGINSWPPRACERLLAPGVPELVEALHLIGSQRVDELCYNGAMIIRWVQGSSEAPVEEIKNPDWSDDGSWQVRPYVMLTTTFHQTVKRPSLEVRAEYDPEIDLIRYQLTAIDLVENRDTEIQVSSDMKSWGHLQTVNAPGTNRITIPFIDLPGQTARFFRLHPDDQTVLAP